MDTARHRLVAALNGPAFLVVTGWTLEPMRRALASGRLERGYVWPDSLASFWYRYQVPAPEDFRFYGRLLEGRSGYVLIGCWAPATPLPPEFSDRSVGLYRRDTLPGTSPDSLPGGEALRFYVRQPCAGLRGPDSGPVSRAGAG